MALPTYTTDHNAIRGFRRQFPHLAALSNDAIRMDMVDRASGAFCISLDAVADLEADRYGATRTQRIKGVPALRRTVGDNRGATVRVRQFFRSLPAGTTRKDAIAKAVEAGFAYATARTQYQYI